MMTEHKVTVNWKRETPTFDYEAYDRTHTIRYEGGIEVKSSSAPQYTGNPAYVNPEEAFTASLSSCHMLTFLAIASKSGYVVDAYEDHPVGIMGKNTAGKTAMTQVRLNPKVIFSGDRIPDEEKFRQLHHKAHANCIIANSVVTPIEVNPEMAG